MKERAQVNVILLRFVDISLVQFGQISIGTTEDAKLVLKTFPFARQDLSWRAKASRLDWARVSV
jgi:hypothetical protein